MTFPIRTILHALSKDLPFLIYKRYETFFFWFLKTRDWQHSKQQARRQKRWLINIPIYYRTLVLESDLPSCFSSDSVLEYSKSSRTIVTWHFILFYRSCKYVYAVKIAFGILACFSGYSVSRIVIRIFNCEL